MNNLDHNLKANLNRKVKVKKKSEEKIRISTENLEVGQRAAKKTNEASTKRSKNKTRETRKISNATSRNPIREVETEKEVDSTGKTRAKREEAEQLIVIYISNTNY